MPEHASALNKARFSQLPQLTLFTTKNLCPVSATLLTRFLLFAPLPLLVCLPFFFCLSAFRRSSSKAGCEVTFLKLAAANAEAMAGVGRICKIRVFRPEKEAPGF